MNILVAADLSGRSDRALARGFALAKELHGTLQVLHVVDADLPAELRDHSVEWARQTLARETEALVTETGVKAELQVIAGHAKVDIVAQARSQDCDLVLLGVHDRSEPKGMHFGRTTAAEVLSWAPVPVLLVARAADEPYRRAIIGVDFSVFSRAAIRYGFGIAPSARFRLVHAYEIPFKGFLGHAANTEQVAYSRRLEFDAFLNEEIALLSRHAAEVGIPAAELESKLQEGAPCEVLEAACAEFGADLLVVGTHGRTGVSRAILGSVAADLLSAPPCDVLVVKPF